MQTDGIAEAEMPKATLKIEVSTRERLKKLGSMEDTFDTVICKLLDEHDEKVKHQDKNQ